MLHLAVTTRLHGTIVDTKTVALDRARVVGDAHGADVAFPGPTLEVEPLEDGAIVGPVTLKAGGQLTLDLGEVEVDFAVVRRAPLARERFVSADVRMLVAMGALVLFGMWCDTLDRWRTHDPGVVAELEALPALWSRLRGEDALSDAPDASRGVETHEVDYIEP